MAFSCGLDTGDFVDCANAFNHFGKDCVAEIVIAVVQVAVVFKVDKELAGSAVDLLRPGHRQGCS